MVSRGLQRCVRCSAVLIFRCDRMLQPAKHPRPTMIPRCLLRWIRSALRPHLIRLEKVRRTLAMSHPLGPHPSLRITPCVDLFFPPDRKAWSKHTVQFFFCSTLPSAFRGISCLNVALVSLCSSSGQVQKFKLPISENVNSAGPRLTGGKHGEASSRSHHVSKAGDCRFQLKLQLCLISATSLPPYLHF